MEWVCGAFQPALIPDWIGNTGPAVAALIAVFIYWRNRINQVRDLQARRRVLQSMIGARIRVTILFARELPGRLKDVMELLSYDAASVLDDSEWMNVPGMARLIELQAQLTAFGDPADFAIARFIESCRIYTSVLERQREIATRRDPKMGERPRLTPLRRAARVLRTKAIEALAAVERYEQPRGFWRRIRRVFKRKEREAHALLHAPATGDDEI